MSKVHLGHHPRPKELWEDFLGSPPGVVGVDTETVSLSDRRLLGIGVALNPQESFYVSTDDKDFPRLVGLLSRPDVRKVYHNAPFDLRVMRDLGVDLINLDDTAWLARLAGTAGTLEELAGWVNREARSAKALMDEYGAKAMDELPLEVLGHKCCVDAQVTLALREHFGPKVDREYYAVERALIPMLEVISSKGIRLDQERRAELESYYQREYDYYKSVAAGMGFRLGSRFEEGYMLSEAGAFLPLTRSRRQLAVDRKTLQKVTAPRAAPIARLILLYRHAEKMLSTYLRPWAGHDRAYTTLHMDAITGRISSTSAGKTNPDRNLQNIPKKVETGSVPTIRSLFVPDGEALTLMDASQIELRVLAHLSGDRIMQQVFDSGGDIHSATERSIWGSDGPMRVQAKTFNFAMVYGGGAYTVADNIGTTDLEKVRGLMHRWMETYPGAARWIREQEVEGPRAGYVETLYGRRIPLPLDQAEKHVQHCAVNYPVQGTAAEIFKRVMLACGGLLEDMRLQVHDELMFEGRVELPSGLETVSPVRVPLDVEVKERWG